VRQHKQNVKASAQYGQGAGEFLPLPGVVDATKLGIKAIKATKGMPVGLSMKIIGEPTAAAPVAAKPITLSNIDQQRLPAVQKIVADGIAANMSPTKMYPSG